MHSDVVELARQLIAIPSINPQEKPLTDPPYGEKAIAQFVCDWFAQQGLNPQLQPVEPHRNNVVVRVPGADPAKTLLLSGHMDTVDVQGMTIEPFNPQIRDGKLFGRGASDMKAPLAALMIAFRDRALQGNLPHNLLFLATCGEEYTMSGSAFFAQHTSEPLAGAVFAEPTGLEVIIAHKGVVRLRVHTHGKSAHSSTPAQGVNAIYAMARAVTAVERFADQVAHGPQHPCLKNEVLSVTIIHGGQQINVIPDSCQAQIDWRILPGRSAVQCRDQLAAFLKDQLPDPIDVEPVNDFSPMQTDPDSLLIQRLLDAAEKVGHPRKTAAWAGATDAGSFVACRIPTLIFGPGNVHKAHTDDEFIEIDQLESGLRAYHHFLQADWGI